MAACYRIKNVNGAALFCGAPRMCGQGLEAGSEQSKGWRQREEKSRAEKQEMKEAKQRRGRGEEIHWNVRWVAPISRDPHTSRRGR